LELYIPDRKQYLMNYSALTGIMVMISILLLVLPASGCSEFILKNSTPGSVISGRTIDFLYSTLTDTNFAVEARGQNHTSLSWLNPGEPGLSWNNTYGFAGVANFAGLVQQYNNELYYLDVLNEAGLSASLLWLNEAHFPRNGSDPDKALIYLDLPGWIAGEFRTVDEVKAGLSSVEIWAPEELDGTYPLHLCVHDANGKSMIVEWVEDGNNTSVMRIYDGDEVDANYGVMTNSPEYPGQLANLEYYQDSNPENHFKGLPGGVSMADRFVRLSKLNEYNQRIPSAMGDISQAFHLLNSVDVAFGNEPSFFEVRGVATIPGDDYTYLSLVRDHANSSYYYRSWRDQSIRKIDLSKMDLNRKTSVLIPVDPDPASGISPLFTDLTDQFKSQ
jgi:choloylglycine hydrolase